MTLPVTLSRAGRFAVLAAVVAGLTVTPAAADQGQPILAGLANTATTTTTVQNTTSGVTCTGLGSGNGLEACGSAGLIGVGTDVGVEAYSSRGTGEGVYAAGATGI